MQQVLCIIQHMNITLPDDELHILDHPVVRGILDTVTDGVLAISLPDREILAMNQVARDMLGYRTRDVLGCQCRKIMNSPACTSACPLSALLEGRKKAGQLDLFYRGKKGKSMLHAHTRMLLLQRPDGTPVAGIELFRDLREEKHLKEALRQRTALNSIIGTAPAMQSLYTLVEQVAPYDIPILITGPSGVGKERFSDAIREHSSRAEGPYLKINCAALSQSLVESELFGHRRGAFTGASTDRRGFFEEASGGTLLLDEVGELPLTTQAKLLRVLQEGEIQRLGEDRVRKVDVRVLAATNRSLEQAVADGAFRGDLYYRLAGARLVIPSLNERKQDIPLLVAHFLERCAVELAKHGGKKPELSDEAMKHLLARDWPGNVRELENSLRLAAIKSSDKGVIEPIHLDFPGLMPQALGGELPLTTLAEMEATAINRAMTEAAGNLGAAARRLGIDRSTLWRKLKKLNYSQIMEKP